MQYRFMRFPNGKPKALTLSYDDGPKYDVKLAKLLDKYGIKCTFNLTNSVTTAKPGDYNLCAEDINKFLLKSGHEVAVHTAHHIAPGQATAATGIKEVLECRLALEKMLGRIIKGMAYPNSGICRLTENVTVDDICSYLKSLGIVYARTLGGDNNSFALPFDWYRWMPTCHHNNPRLMEWLEEFKGINTENSYYSTKYPRLFYLWGHTHEFERQNNWEIIEKFCESAAQAVDIWFATNMEICEYTNAYYSLHFSADETIVHNPTVITVWFEMDGKLYTVKPGETLKLS